MRTTERFLGMAFCFPIFFILGGYGGKLRQTSLMMKKMRRSYVFKIGTDSVLCWLLPLLLPESGNAAPAMLVSSLGSFPRETLTP